jgi:pimeloyl-ACP methyl ester carboxylesterase
LQEDFSENILVESKSVNRNLAGSRFLGGMIKSTASRSDWFTKDVFLNLHKTDNQMIGTKDVSLLNHQIKIKKHSNLTAKIGLSELHTITRNIGGRDVIISNLATENQDIELFNFGLGAKSRNTQAQQFIELSDIQGDVSINNPLQIEVDAQLNDNEILLPFTFDGEFILPIGIGKRGQNGEAIIEIDAIPDEVAKSRSLGRALKFCLYKLSSKLFNIPSNGYNQLQAVEYVEDGNPIYECDYQQIRDKVASANKILLLIHGIIGNTEEMVAFAHHLIKAKVYDLILTFDYENLNTPIEQISYQLKRRLVGDEADYQGEKLTGIGIGEDKKIDILAHSMGGLVSRWLIEQKEGYQFVNRLIMCGTPNGGSVFGKIDDYRKFATIGLAIGANAFLPFKVILGLGALLSGMKIAQTSLGTGALLTQTLAQMKQDSPFIHSLNVDGKAANIPYYILAGDVQQYQTTNEGLFNQLYAKILKLVGNYANNNQPNDVAVLVKDIKQTGKNQEVDIKDVACHHLNYFTDKTSVDLLLEILSRNE